jgi:hypothetical protein
MKRLLGTCAALALFAAAGSAQAVTLYANDFDSVATVHSGVGVTFSGFTLHGATVGGWNGVGWANNYADNRSGGGGSPSGFTTLTLTNLAPHSTVSVDFILGFLESWDARLPNGYSPDNLELYIDSVLVADMTTNNALGGEAEEDFDGATELYEDIQANDEAYYDDTLVDMGAASFMSFAHTNSTLTLALRATGAGWQGGTDEGFGLDNIFITYDGVRGGVVPEPATWGLMIMGFGATGAMVRSRRRMLAAA